MSLFATNTSTTRFFAAGTTPAVVPPSPPLTNLVAWLDASVGVFQDTALTIPSVLNGDPIKGWQDQSSANNDALFVDGGGGATANVTLKLSALNSQSSTLWANNLNYLKFATLVGSQPQDIFIVFKCSGNHIIVGSDSSNSNYISALNAITDAFSGIAYYSLGDNAYHVLEPYTNGTNLVVNIDSVLSSTTATPDGIVFNSVGEYGPAGGGDAVAFNFVGEIAEIIIYNAVLSSDDRDLVNSYLSDKYAIF